MKWNSNPKHNILKEFSEFHLLELKCWFGKKKEGIKELYTTLMIWVWVTRKNTAIIKTDQNYGSKILMIGFQIYLLKML